MSLCLSAPGTGRLSGHLSVAREGQLTSRWGRLPWGAATMILRADHRALQARCQTKIPDAISGRQALYAAGGPVGCRDERGQTGCGERRGPSRDPALDWLVGRRAVGEGGVAWGEE